MRHWFAIPALLILPLGLTATDSSDILDADCRPIVDRYVDATHTQQLALRDVQMEVDIDAKLVKLQKQGRLQALRSISKIGRITYKALGFSGDNTVKQEVIARYLSAESEGRDNGSISITPANYKFKYKSTLEW